MFDEKEDEIDQIYQNLLNIESEYKDNVKILRENESTEEFRAPLPNRKRGLGFKASSSGSSDTRASENSIKVLTKEYIKDIEAGQSTLNDLLSKIVSTYVTPATLFDHIKSLYLTYCTTGSFPIAFDLYDMVPYIQPYIKISLIKNFHILTFSSAPVEKYTQELHKYHDNTFNKLYPPSDKFINELRDLLKDKQENEGELEKVNRVHSQLTQGDRDNNA